MKKLWFFAIIYFGFFVFCHSVGAESDDYNSFAKIEVSSGKLLSKYTDSELKEYDENVAKSKFLGWNTYIINKEVSANFISETLFSFYNDGTTAIDYELQTVTNTTTKLSISATGSISYSLKGDIKKFKHGLDTTLKMETAYTKTVDIKQTEKFKLQVDPGTIAVLYLTGTGKFTNGVARYYIFWFVNQKGGFEYFWVTDLYPRIEKIKI